MSLRISYCPYRLLFKHPFETSHGVRDGTDSIFIRLEENGAVGHGEVTLPPYLKEQPRDVIDRLEGAEVTVLQTSGELLACLQDERAWGPHQQGCRAGLYSAWIDLIGQHKQLSAGQILNIEKLKSPRTMVTIGITPVAEVETVLHDLPFSDVLKVKTNGLGSIPMLRAVLQADPRPVFIDANQGLNAPAEAEKLVQTAHERFIAIEQPFNVNDRELQILFQKRSKTITYGDESIQGLADLDAAQHAFKGVNIKLMKCGGLDRAKAMADRAAELGMQVMLGSMSESSLGCTAMAHLAGQADLLDLDGPWLIRNDPFVGMDLQGCKLVMPKRAGIGAVPIGQLAFVPAGGMMD